MRLVHREQRDANGLQSFRGRADVETFRRHIQQLQVAPLRAHQPITHLRAGERAVDERRRNTATFKRVNLILHERNQGRHDDREATRDECWHLIAERLATTRRQHDERVAFSEHALDGALLAGAKCAIAEARLQHGACVVECGGGQHAAWQQGKARPRRGAPFIITTEVSPASSRRAEKRTTTIR